MQLNNAVRKSLQRSQPERHITMSRGDKGNTFADERRYDGDDELVNRALIQERSDNLASAH